MPNMPKTPTKSFRCPEHLWVAAKEAAARDDLSVTDVLVKALMEYTGVTTLLTSE